MTIQKKISENDMILEFLQAELDSSRFGNKINAELLKLNLNRDILTNADLEDTHQNKMRKDLFRAYRDYENEQGLFAGFPKDIEWYEAELSRKELLSDVHYINYDYWIELSKGSRLPKDAARSIEQGVEVFKQSNSGFLSASNAFKKGKKFHKLILVSDRKKAVVLEGHLRITVYALNPELIPETLSVIIGYSDNMSKWGLF